MSNDDRSGSGGLWDCHFHYFENARYPLAPGGAYTPQDASLEDFRALCKGRGIQRAVLVHPSVYGADHASFEDALASHRDWLRGVAVVYADQHVTTDAQLERWNDLGTRGSRINRLFPGAPNDVDTIIRRIRPFGWHVQLLIDLVKDMALVRRVADAGVPVVVDHFGHHDPAGLLRSAAFADLQALMRAGLAWVKLSAPYRLLQRDHAHGASVAALADALVHANPHQLVWGSDWPHPPNHKQPFPIPDESAIRSTIDTWLVDTQLRQLVMSLNPRRLYDGETRGIPGNGPSLYEGDRTSTAPARFGSATMPPAESS